MDENPYKSPDTESVRADGAEGIGLMGWGCLVVVAIFVVVMCAGGIWFGSYNALQPAPDPGSPAPTRR